MWLFRSSIVIFLFSALGLYAGLRVFRLFRYLLPGGSAWVFWPLFALLWYSFILVNLLNLDRFPFPRQAAMYLLALFVYLILCFLAFDILRLLLRLWSRNPLGPRFTAIGIAAAASLALLITIFGAFHARVIQTAHYSVTIPKPGKNLRITLISDLHIGATVGRRWIARIVDRVNESEPDMVCIAGDIFDGNLDAVKDLPGIASELRRIKARNGVYACLGNHDVDRMRLFRDDAGTDRIAEFLREANILLLADEAARISDTVYIAGRRDARPIGMRQSRISAAELAAKADGETADRERVLVMLDHQPVEFHQIEAAGVDLLLCGHTHKGQIFPANLITRRVFSKAGAVHYGYWQGKTMQAVVTSGAGVWGPPLRVGTNSETAVIDIRFSGN